MALIDAWDIKSKCGVSPLITQPRTINASYLLIFFEIVTGISKTPDTLIIFIVYEFFNFVFAEFNKPVEISL